MRGFPLLRSLLVLIWLGVAAVVLAKLTHPTTPPPPRHEKIEIHRIEPDGGKIPLTAFTISTSAEIAELVINGAKQSLEGHRPGIPFSAPLHAEGNPDLITIVVRWKTPPAPGEHRFAKLTVHPPGKPTINHIFDSTGDIDDVLELP